jgi:hypothetical protein
MVRLTSSRSRAWLLGLALAAAALLTGCGADAPADPFGPPVTSTALLTPTATATPTPTAMSAAAPAGPRAIETVTPSGDVVAKLAEVDAFVARLRGHGLTGEAPRAFVDSANMRALLDNELADPEAVAAIRDESLLLHALGLLGTNVDLLEAYRGLLGSQVVGLYTPDDRALYVLANAAPGPVELTTYAHEFHHALQDQRFDLRAIERATKGNRDAALAASTLIEGDAVFTQTVYVQQVLGTAGALALLGAANASPPPASAPRVLLDMLRFPYEQGLMFTAALARQGGGVGAIDAAFARLPASSEQVLHPEKYLAGEAPRAVTRPFAVPPRWTIEDEDVLGEYLLQRWLREFGLAVPVASAAATGWGGDRYAIVRGPAGPPALLAYIEWDSPTDIDEFIYALFPAGPGNGLQLRTFASGRSIALVRVDASTLGLAVAPDAATADLLSGLLGAR